MAHRVLELFPQLRRITDASFVQRCLLLSRAHRLVSERARFISGEIRGGTRTYRLAADPMRRVVVRHGTRDIEVLAEIFRTPVIYEPPLAAAEMLREIAHWRQLRVLDLGANVGLFAVDTVSRYPSAEITSYEPDPENVRVLVRCAELNQVKTWTVTEGCARSSDGNVRLAAGKFADSHVSDIGIDVVGIDVLPLLGSYDYVKMDIEGSEWPILCDPRWVDAMRGVAVFALEWHVRGDSPPNPRAAAISAVAEAGFIFEASQPGWNHGMVWGWRPP